MEWKYKQILLGQQEEHTVAFTKHARITETCVVDLTYSLLKSQLCCLLLRRKILPLLDEEKVKLENNKS